MEKNYELYLAPGQKGGRGVTCLGVEAHLHETGLIERVFSLDDKLVEGWLANPETYPAELKGQIVFLWGSTAGSGWSRRVALLFSGDDELHKDWCPLAEEVPMGPFPNLLKPSVN